MFRPEERLFSLSEIRLFALFYACFYESTGFDTIVRFPLMSEQTIKTIHGFNQQRNVLSFSFQGQ